MNHRAEMPLVGVAMGEWASWYAGVLGWPVFPCKGKKPRTKNGFKDATTDLEQIKAWWAKWPTANIGTPTGDGFYVIDQDNRADGHVTLQGLEDSYSAVPPTVTCLTGRKDGSQHKYFVGAVVNKADLGAGLDVQGDGSYVILPPSIHPDTGLRYEWEADFSPDDIAIAPAPEWLTALVTTPKPAVPEGLADAPDAALALMGVMASDDPIVEHYRNNTLFALAEYKHRHGMHGKELSAYIHGINATRCQPPLPFKEITEILKSAHNYPDNTALYTANKVERNGVPTGPNTAMFGYSNTQSPGSSANVHETALENMPWYQYSVEPYKVNKKGKIEANNGTITAFLLNHADWAGRLWWDDMASKIMLQTGDHSTELEEAEITRIGAKFCDDYYVAVGSDALMGRCLLAVAQQQKRDPLQHWLHALPGWDMESRLETWLRDCAGVEDNAYTRFCSKILPVSMIARAEDPGCICRAVLILQGPEEYRKSTFVSSLVPFPQWYDELTGTLENKEAHLMVQGLWVAELGELDALSRTEETKLKSFISLRADSHIPKFKSMRIQPKRRTIFVGTTNEETYLKGQSGNTRYLPVTITKPIDVEKFLAMRDLIFAEALIYYGDNPEQWWRMSSEAHRIAVREREQRRQASWLEEDLADWLTKRRFHNWKIRTTLLPAPEVEPILDETTWREIATGYYQLASREKWKDLALQRQTAQALKVLGWVPRVVFRENLTQRVWIYQEQADITLK